MALYEQYDTKGVKIGRAFTVDGSDEDGQYAAKASVGAEGWEKADEPPTSLFDPGEHTVPEVLAHLEHADEAEVARVLAAEQAGQQRKGILEKKES